MPYKELKISDLGDMDIRKNLMPYREADGKFTKTIMYKAFGIKRPYKKILNCGFKNIKTGKVYIAKKGRGIKGICLEICSDNENNYFHVSYYKLRKYYREI